MRILVIGATGTIGKRLTPVLAKDHEIISAGRNSGDVQVDISSEQSIKDLFQQIKNLDAVICIAASGPMDNFATLTGQQLQNDFKEYGQLFPGMAAVPMKKLIMAYSKTISENITGQVLRVYE